MCGCVCAIFALIQCHFPSLMFVTFGMALQPNFSQVERLIAFTYHSSDSRKFISHTTLLVSMFLNSTILNKIGHWLLSNMWNLSSSELQWRNQPAQLAWLMFRSHKLSCQCPFVIRRAVSSCDLSEWRSPDGDHDNLQNTTLPGEFG